MRKLLFVCSRNKLRSPTAEVVFSEVPGIEVESAGLNRDAEVPLDGGQIAWADVVFVMEKAHLVRLKRRFSEFLGGKEVVVLNIPDNYAYMDAELVEILKSRCRRYL